MQAPRRLLKYVLAYKGRLIVAGLCGLGIAGTTLLMAGMINWFTTAADTSKDIDALTRIWAVAYALKHHWFAHDVQSIRFGLIEMTAVLVVIIYVPKFILGYLNAYLVASVTNRVGTDIRDEMYTHLQTLPLSYFHRSKIGHIISRMSYDVGLIQNSSLVVMQAIDGPAMIIAGLFRMFMLSWKLALLAVFFVPPMSIGVDRLTKRIKRLTVDTQEKLADVNAYVDESIRGVRIVKTFGMEGQEIKRFARANTNSLIAALRAARRNSVVMPAIDFMGGVSGALIMLIGGWMVSLGQISFPTLSEFIFLAFMVAGAGKQFGRLNVMYQQTMAGAERIFELLDTKSDLVEDPNGAVLTNVKGRVQFEEVEFEYAAGEVVLDGVSFAIEPGEIVAIVGPSGAGKSTIADLIPRFYDVTGGRILVEGVDVRNIKTASLREQIAMVPQETILFSGTIGENIAYGRPGASMAEIVEASKAANAHEFIAPLPKGYDTELGEGGVGLSGGQRQRISIARALLKNPKILILDEATSSLDAASEGVVQEALDRLMQGRSTLVIAHRLSTVTGADRILVLDRGRIVESGSFDELMSRGGLFAQLYKVQFRAEETV